MTNELQWTNKSVLAFAQGRDPVTQMEEHAKLVVLEAMDQGWKGPPFDPVSLAKVLKLSITPRSDIPDARTVPTPEGLNIEYNPLRPRGRIRFSVAHEIAHSFFPDCAEQVRHRGSSHAYTQDEWQLEVLCNIGAAELLMPTGSFPELARSDLDIHSLMELRRKFDVSTEALLIRTVKLTSAPCAAFCATRHDDETAYRLDYLIPSRKWRIALRPGISLPTDSILQDANAIGYTTVGQERWGGNELKVQGVALAPYPGGLVPRVVGLISPPEVGTDQETDIELVTADALEPRGNGKRILAHVVPDSTIKWGGGGFAAQLRKRYPQVQEDFATQARQSPKGLLVGQSYRGRIGRDIYVLHMVAQRGHGQDRQMRIRYSALRECLRELNNWASQERASVHMPKIGSGHGGGDWNVIRELILEELVRKGTAVTVYQLP